MTTSGFVTTIPGPHTLQTGKPGLGGTGGGIGAAFTGGLDWGGRVSGDVLGVKVPGIQPQKGVTMSSKSGQNAGSMKPKIPALSKNSHVPWVLPSIITMASGLETTKPGPQTLQTGKPGLGGTGEVIGETLAGDGERVSGETLGANVPGAQPQGAAKPVTMGQKLGSMNPNIPALSNPAHVVGACVGIVMTTSGFVTTIPGPHTLQTGNPGLGGTGAGAWTGDVEIVGPGGSVEIGANVPGAQPHGVVN